MSVMTKNVNKQDAGDTEVTKQMQSLNDKWRTYVAQICGIDSKNGAFQVAQGNLGLQTSDSSGLFLMADTVPTDSPSGLYQSSSIRRSSGYDSLLFSMAPQDGSELRNILSDQYANWVEYRIQYYSDPKNDLPQEKVFAAWANGHLDSNTMQKAIGTFKQSVLSPLNKAIDAYNDKSNQQQFVESDGAIKNLYRYTGTIDNAKNAIAQGQAINEVNFDSSTQTIVTDHTYAEAEVSGFFDIFSGGADTSFNQLNEKAQGSSITVTGHIGKNGVLLTQPGNWYDTTGIVSTAFSKPNDNTVWNAKASNDWDSFFKQPDGMLSRYVTSMLLVSDYELTVTIKANFDVSEYQKITASASGGIWPFFSAKASATHTHTYNHNDDGSLSYTISLNKGLIGIWGVTYRPAP
jgi:hypothetical protein